jgi:hypothetical protein
MALASLAALVFGLAGAGLAQTKQDLDPCVRTWTLWAGQTIDVGKLTVTNDVTNLYVTFELTYPGATFGTLHLWAGNDPSGVPANPQGTPVPGQFPFIHDASGQTLYQFVIPFENLEITDVNQVCNVPLYVVAHAEVTMDSDGDGDPDAETAFGGDHSGPGPRWWYYAIYPICCEDGPPPVRVCETAFAKGGWVFTTDPKSNPENLPSLRLTKNRWGWAINLLNPGTTVYQIWAGAGLNYTSHGTLVGTLTINWDGSTAVVTYNLTVGYLLEEVHLFAGDFRPITLAPGQYGNLDHLDPGRLTYQFSVPLTDTNGDGVWLIAHAIVSGTSF